MSTNNDDHPIPHYLFGHSAQETQQLQLQARALFPATRHFLQRAGLTQGMRVLEVGSGAGDVALLAADLVGPTGQVIGIEKNPRILETARKRAQAAGVLHVSFQEADLTSLQVEHEFDALVGRYILQHLPEPATALRQLAQYVRPGGIVVFLEADLTHLGTCVPHAPLFEQVGEWIKEAFRRSGIDTQMGLRLYHVFLEAGLPAPQIACESFIGGGTDWPWYELIAGRVRSLLPALLQHRIATQEEIGIETLAFRLRDALVSQRGVGMAPDLIAAWTQL
ncbi:MAG TPA: methyltransferase domain-containing protein [Ktedonobacteraceae bacterium]|jgi:SAM-dependent methyltransferase|nr:methyltransferase domain-containing protein [Ktedonobacteraceae bacterium]